MKMWAGNQMNNVKERAVDVYCESVKEYLASAEKVYTFSGVCGYMLTEQPQRSIQAFEVYCNVI